MDEGGEDIVDEGEDDGDDELQSLAFYFYIGKGDRDLR